LKQNNLTTVSRYNFESIDRYVSLVDATVLLGFNNYQSVIHLAERGVITIYDLPNTTRKRVLLSDVSKLVESRKKKDLSEKNKDSFNKAKCKRKPGRPRKYEL